MIDIEDVLSIHQVLIERFGGAQGLKDKAGLEAALNRPFATFDQQDLYSTPLEKAAALIESLLINHPFVDGNKRIGYTMTRIFLRSNGWDFTATIDERYDFVIAIAAGKMKYGQILSWLKMNTISIDEA